MEEKYKFKYDDPYRMLAASTAVRLTQADARRIMNDKAFIRQIVQSEIRDNTDIPGMFSDCVTSELLSNSQKVLYRSALNELGLFFFEQLDIDRYRKELKDFYAEFGIDITQ